MRDEITVEGKQRILVFQQLASGERKIEGILRFGDGRFDVRTVSLDLALPAVLDEVGDLLPQSIAADLVLDFMKHPDLSHELAALCISRGIPIIASGKKLRNTRVLTPPT